MTAATVGLDTILHVSIFIALQKMRCFPQTNCLLLITIDCYTSNSQLKRNNW